MWGEKEIDTIYACLVCEISKLYFLNWHMNSHKYQIDYSELFKNLLDAISKLIHLPS